LRRFDSPVRFLLKGVDDPKVSANLHGIDDAKRISAVLQRDLKNAAIDALEGLCRIRLAPSGR
jgi:hypothetical protein